MEKYLEPEAFDLPAKNPSVEAQRRWRDAVSFVRNRRRRFRYASNLEKREEAKEQMEKTRVCYCFYTSSSSSLVIFCFCQNTPENESENCDKSEEDLFISFCFSVKICRKISWKRNLLEKLRRFTNFFFSIWKSRSVDFFFSFHY